MIPSNDIAKMLDHFIKETAKTAEISIRVPEYSEFQGKRLFCRMVRKGDDVIFQLFDKFPPNFEALLAEVVESHFGATEGFKIDHVKELGSYALLGKDLLARPTVNMAYVTTGFLTLLDDVLNSPEIRGPR